jgi:hypothetical protein
MKKYFVFLFLFLASCNPQFPRERARAFLEFYYTDVTITDYYEYPNCNKAYTYSFEARDVDNRTQSGLLCCDTGGKCLLLEQKK